MEMELAESWVAIAFLVFVGILLYAGTHRAIVALDKAGASPARGGLLLKSAEAGGRVQAQAAKGGRGRGRIHRDRCEGGRSCPPLRPPLEDFRLRRTKMAEEKIAQAEQQAIADVKATPPIPRAARLRDFSAAATGQAAERLISNALSEVKSKLN